MHGEKNEYESVIFEFNLQLKDMYKTNKIKTLRINIYNGDSWPQTSVCGATISPNSTSTLKKYVIENGIILLFYHLIKEFKSNLLSDITGRF